MRPSASSRFGERERRCAAAGRRSRAARRRRAARAPRAAPAARRASGARCRARRRSQLWPKTRASCSTTRALPAAAPSSGSARSSRDRAQLEVGRRGEPADAVGDAQPHAQHARRCATPAAVVEREQRRAARPSIATVPLVVVAAARQRRPARTPVGAAAATSPRGLRARPRARPRRSRSSRARSAPSDLAEQRGHREARARVGRRRHRRRAQVGARDRRAARAPSTRRRARGRARGRRRRARPASARRQQPVQQAQRVGGGLGRKRGERDRPSGVPSSSRSVTAARASAASARGVPGAGDRDERDVVCSPWPARRARGQPCGLFGRAVGGAGRGSGSRRACRARRTSRRWPAPALRTSPRRDHGAVRSTRRAAGAVGPCAGAERDVHGGRRHAADRTRSRSSSRRSCAAAEAERADRDARRAAVGGGTMRPSPPSQRCASASSPPSMSRAVDQLAHVARDRRLGAQRGRERVGRQAVEARAPIAQCLGRRDQSRLETVGREPDATFGSSGASANRYGSSGCPVPCTKPRANEPEPAAAPPKRSARSASASRPTSLVTMRGSHAESAACGSATKSASRSRAPVNASPPATASSGSQPRAPTTRRAARR